jgi:hypothetical protein
VEAEGDVACLCPSDPVNGVHPPALRLASAAGVGLTGAALSCSYRLRIVARLLFPMNAIVCLSEMAWPW